MGLPLAKLHAVAAVVGPLPGRVRTFFAGGESGVWYDPSDLSTMFQNAAGAQTAVSATGQSVGLILDKRLGLALGSPAGTNLDFASAGTDWNVLNADGTHIVTFGVGSCRVQSDTTTPALTVQKGTVFTSGLWYRLDVTISAYTSGGIKFSGGAFEVEIPQSVGTHTIYFLAASTVLTFTRSTTNVDLTLSSIVARPVAGYHAYQTTSGSRPIYRNANSTHYLEFDGVDDFLRSTFTITQPLDRVSSIRQVTWNASDRLFADVNGTTGGILFQRFGGTTPEIGTYAGTNVTMAPHLALGINGVITERQSGASSRVALNSDAYVTGNAGTAVPGGITIGANDVGTQAGNFHFHQLIERGGPTALVDAQIAYARALCTLKAGLISDAEILKLFSASEQGAWYDPSDLSTMFQEQGGFTPVTATGQTVGLILDKRLGLALGTQIIVNGDNVAALMSPVFATNVSVSKGLAPDSVTPAAVGLLSGGSAAHNIRCVIPADTGIIVTVRVWVPTGSLAQCRLFDVNDGSWFSATTTVKDSWVTLTGRRAPKSTSWALGIGNNSVDSVDGASYYVTDFSVRPIAGNHAFQATSGARPIFRDVAGLRYLEFDGVDDFLRALFTITEPIDRISAIQQPVWANSGRIFDGGAVNAATLFQNGVTPRLDFYSGTAILGTTALAVGVNGVITERYQGASSRLALNSGVYATGNTGALLPGGITIGASSTGTNRGSPFIFQVIERGSTTAMTDNEIAVARARCQQKSGAAL